MSFILVCQEANTDQPFMCLDLTFIWMLLEKGFGLRPDTTVFVSVLCDTFMYLMKLNSTQLYTITE